MDIQSLLDRIDESIITARTPETTLAGLARDWTVRQTPSDATPSSKKTSISHPFLSQSIASISGVPHDITIQFMQMLEQGVSWVTAAEKLALSTGQAMDIKSAMVNVGAYKEPGQLAEELRFLADRIYRLADDLVEDEDLVFEATRILRDFSLLREQSGPEILDAGLPADALVLVNAYADAIADMLTLPPDNPPVIWGDAVGDEQEAHVEGSVGDKLIRVHISMRSSEAPFMRFSVPQLGSKVIMKLTSHNWMAPLTLTMQHVMRALLQNDFHYSELEQHRRVNPKPVEEARRSYSEYQSEKLKSGPVDYATDEELLQAGEDMSTGAHDALSDAYDRMSIYVKTSTKAVYRELVSLGLAHGPVPQFAPNMLELTREGRSLSIMLLG